MTIDRPIGGVTSPAQIPPSTPIQEAAVTDHPEPQAGVEGITTGEAHEVMQVHSGCDGCCAMRTAARQVLITAGHYSLAS